MPQEYFRLDTQIGIINKNSFVANDDRLRINLGGIEDLIFKETVINIYTAYPYSSAYSEPTVVIDTTGAAGEMRYEVPDSAFGNKLIPCIEELINIHWPFLKERKSMTPTRQWLTTAAAISYIQDRRDLSTFGGMMPTEENADAQQEALEMNWGIHSFQRAELMVESLIKCRTDAQYRHVFMNADPERYSRELIELVQKVNSSFGERGIIAWDLVRAIFLACSSYVAGYMSIENASQAALRAACKIQQSFSGWSDMSHNYLMGFDFWFNNANKERRSAFQSKKKILEDLINAENSPYNTVDWNMELKEDW